MTPGTRIEALEGIRGLALLPVFALHYLTLFGFLVGGTTESPMGWENLGQGGVDLFFLLSGYLVYGLLLGKGVTPGVFLQRRGRRIYPAFLVVFVVYLGLSAAFPERSKIPHGWADGGLYLAANLLLLPGIVDIPPLIRVAWSLSYEVAFYTLLPLAAWMTGFVRRAVRVRVAWIAALAVMYWCACWWGGGWYVPALRLAPLGHPRLVLFLVGMVVREAHGTGWKLPGRAGWWGAWFCVVMCGLWWAPAPSQVRPQCLEAALMAAGGGPLLFWAALPENRVATSLSWGGLRWLGQVSYSFYLVHGLAMQVLAFAMVRVWNGAAGIWWFAGLGPVVFAAAAAAAAVLYTQVERRLSLSPRAKHPIAVVSAA